MLRAGDDCSWERVSIVLSASDGRGLNFGVPKSGRSGSASWGGELESWGNGGTSGVEAEGSDGRPEELAGRDTTTYSASSGGVGGFVTVGSAALSRGMLRTLLKELTGALASGFLVVVDGGGISRLSFGAGRGSGFLRAGAGANWSREAAGRRRGFRRPEWRPSREGEGRTVGAGLVLATGVGLGTGRRESLGIPLGLPDACFSSIAAAYMVLLLLLGKHAEEKFGELLTDGVDCLVIRRGNFG